MSYNYFQQTVVPSTSAWSIGTINRPFKDIWLSYGSINLANQTSGVSGIALSNSANFLTLGQGTAGIQILNPSGSSIFQATSAGKIATIVPTIPAGDIGAFSIVGSTGGAVQPIVNAGGMLHITGNDGSATRVTIDSFGQSTNTFPAIVGRAGRGTAATPTQILSGDVMLRISAVGYNAASGFYLPVNPQTSPTTIEAVAVEDFTNSVGSQWNFYNAASGSNTKQLQLSINSLGVTVPVASAGITFGDGTFQNTAFNSVSGIWTPQLSAGTIGTGFGYNGALTTGSYYKTGKTVYATFSVVLSSTDAASGNVFLTNLPYPINIGSGVWGDLRVYRYSNLDTKTASVAGGNEGSATAFTLYWVDNTGGASSSNLTVARLTNTSALYGALQYITS